MGLHLLTKSQPSSIRDLKYSGKRREKCPRVGKLLSAVGQSKGRQEVECRVRKVLQRKGDQGDGENHPPEGMRSTLLVHSDSQQARDLSLTTPGGFST